MGTTILYIPRIKPDPPSSLRQLAYHEGTPIPGPKVDPEGWKVLESFTMNGSILNARAVQVTCTVREVFFPQIFADLSFILGLPRQTCKILPTYIQYIL